MVLSIIIVNYRVKYFLELCLHSVEKALKGLEAEVWVVDNDSGDGSVEYLRTLFPWVQFITNKANRGFGAANNQALEKARGKYILFLNPDTVLPEDFATACLSFLESTPKMGGLGEKTHEGEDAGAADLRSAGPERVGAVGVRMVDGSGRFLKESRRGFPSPWVAFCKLTGLTALFPHSRLFAAYYLGYRSPEATQRAPILSGACLWVSRAILEEVGGFDEQFFMYAEDIDLSYRIEKAGFHNYYFPDTTIVHFKGESTQKDIRYVKLFYKAMSQFRRKHFHGGLSVVFNAFMEAAIWLRAALSALGRLLRGRNSIIPDGESDTGPVKSWLTGDPEAVERLSAHLSSSGERLLVEGPEWADEIIFCEGKAFSFKEAIASLQTVMLRPGSQLGMFFPAGSHSVTGSASRDDSGETIII
jgi:N-acetylglucosaminyl-diphospho-decaprenol L-rhamnosyltransferase